MVHHGERYFRASDYHCLGAFLLDAGDTGCCGDLDARISGFRFLCARLVRDNRDYVILVV
jgi:hypothetical protein